MHPSRFSPHRPFLALGAALAALLGANSSPAADDLAGLTAKVSRPVYPVLIGNPYCPLVRVTLTVGKPPGWLWQRNDLHATSLSFTLSGTDDLADIESVALVTTEGDERFKLDDWPNNPPGAWPGTFQTVVTPIGKPAGPAAQVVFRFDRFLKEGANVFWLTCRLKPSASLAHHVVADCTGIGTSSGSLTAPDPAAGLRQRIGVAVRDRFEDGVDTYGIPVIATTAQGTLLACYDMRWNYPGHDLQDKITTGLSRSTDGGQTWEPMKAIMDMRNYGGLPPEQNGCSDPGIIVDRQTGEIFVFAVWMHGVPHRHQWKHGAAPGYEVGVAPQMLLVTSRDDGKTWSQPKNLTRRLKKEAWCLIAPAPTQGFQMADGTLVMPIQGRDENDRQFDTIMTSRDHGASWVVGSPTGPRLLGECAAAELGDGSIMLNARNGNMDDTAHFRGVYVTRDLGRTWRAHETNFDTLIEPMCNASLLRVDYEEGGVKKHVLLFENPHESINRERSHDTLQVSFDDGRTWPLADHILLDQGYGWSYPCLTRIDANRIGILYAGSQAQIQFQVLTLDEILHR